MEQFEAKPKVNLLEVLVSATEVFHCIHFIFFLFLFSLSNCCLRLEFHGKRDVFRRVAETDTEPERNSDEVHLFIFRFFGFLIMFFFGK